MHVEPMTKKKVGSRKKKLREKLFLKHKGKCFYCGVHTIYNHYEITPNTECLLATIDHIVPKIKGGTSAQSNCVLSCHRCNEVKTNLDLEDFLLYQAVNPNFSRMDWIFQELLETEEEAKEFFLLSDEERQFVQLRTSLLVEDSEIVNGKKLLGRTRYTVLGDINVRQLKRQRQAGRTSRAE